MKKTYRSKKDAPCALDHRDVLTTDAKSSVFDAFYIKNLKKTKQQQDASVCSMQFAASNKVRKRKYVRRVKEKTPPPIEYNMSRSTYLTPDKSIHLNRAPDLFDQLLNSSPADIQKEIYNKIQMKDQRCYRGVNRKNKKINCWSSDSSDSDKENSITNINSSDIKQHMLIIEKKDSPKQKDESINNILNNLSLFKLENNCSTIDALEFPIISKDKNSQPSAFNSSPLCSTPFNKKYRGKSIYRFSPIGINLEESPRDPRISNGNKEINVTDNEESILEKAIDSQSQLRNKSEYCKADDRRSHDNISYIDGNADKVELATHISGIIQTIEEEPFVGFSNNIETSEIKETSYKVKNLCIDNLPSEPFLGFSHVEIDNDLKENNEVSSTNAISNSTSIEADNESLYDTCSTKEADSSTDHCTNSKSKEAIIVLNKINNSIFEKYYKQPDYNLENNHDKISDESTQSDNHSLEEAVEYDKSLSEEENEIQNDINGHDKSDNSCNELNLEEKCFVTTRRRNKITNDFSILVFDHSYTINENTNILDNNSINEDHIKDNQNCDITLIRDNIETFGGQETIVEDNTIDKNVEINKSDIFNKQSDDLPVIDKVNSITTRRSSRLTNANKTIETMLFKDNLISNSLEINKSDIFNKQSDDLPVIDKVNSITTRRSSRLTNANKTIETMLFKDNLISNSLEINKSDIFNKQSDDLPVIDKVNSITTRRSSRLTNANKTIETMLFKDNLISNSFENNEDIKPSIVLQPGKKWERSLSIYRRMTTMADNFDQSILDKEDLKCKGRKYRQSVICMMEMQESKGCYNDSMQSRRSTFSSKPCRPCIKIMKETDVSRLSICSTNFPEELQGFLNEDCDDTVIELSNLSIADCDPEVTIIENIHDTSHCAETDREYVLKRCDQTDAILFDECYPDTVLKNCRKIGEGVYGEVFLWRARDGRARVLKVIPIAGNIKVNGENQKDFGEIISEIVIAMELSALRTPIAEIEQHLDEGKDIKTLDLHSVANATDVFNEVIAVRCVYGSYPSRMLDLWELYDECKGSDNDNPAVLPVDQQFIVLELANAGLDLESYQFNNAEQAYSIFKQVAYGLAVAEEAFQFEHRDLHWGNVLIQPTEEKYALFVLRGCVIRVARRGVAATVIDYSLSRLALRPQRGAPVALFHDLATDDELFTGRGDYQFELYRLMRRALGNNWENYEPYTNVLWLHYTIDKMITSLRYTRPNSKIHKQYIVKLTILKEQLLAYRSATELVLTHNEL